MNSADASGGDLRHLSLKPYRLGITLSAALAILLITLSLIALLTPNLDYGVVLLILLALVIGLPLGLALLLTWLAYRRSASTPLPAKLHAAMFLPTLAALSVLPIGAGIQDTARRWFSEAHPDIRELHVNFSGRPLWLAVGSAQTGAGSWPRMPLLSGPEARFAGFIRHPQEDDVNQGRFPYAGSRLGEGEHSYAYADTDEAGQPVAVRPRPLLLRPYPDLGRLPSDLRESDLLVYQYFHYYDHVDVAPALGRLDASKLDELQGRLGNVVSFYLSDQYPRGLARLEIDGQTLVIGTDNERVFEAPWDRRSSFVGSALLDIQAPLAVRWQTLDDPARWHEASVSVPAFQGTTSRAMQASVRNVRLYFLDGGVVAAEQFLTQNLLGGDQRTVTTGVPVGVRADRICDNTNQKNIDAFSG